MYLLSSTNIDVTDVLSLRRWPAFPFCPVVIPPDTLLWYGPGGRPGSPREKAAIEVA